MGLLPSTTAADVVIVADDEAPFPPTSWAIVPWGIPASEFDLDFHAASAVDVTVATLYGATTHLGVIADDVVESVDTTANTLTLTAHNLTTGDGPVQMTTTDTVPGGLAILTDYWIIRTSANAIQLATSFANAIAGTAIDLSAGAAGTNTIVDTADTQIVVWHSHGLINGGSFSLSARLGLSVRCAHDARRFAYAISATYSSAVLVTATISPVLR